MDGTTPAVNYLFSPTSNDYYDHHSLQPLQSLSSLSYYPSDAIDCFYEHHKSNYPSPPSYIYHSTPHPSQTQQSYGYNPSIYDIQSAPPFVQESNLILLQNQTRLPPVYELPSPCQTLQPMQLQTTVSVSGRHMKRELDDESASTLETSEKNHVYEWMKGNEEIFSIRMCDFLQEIKFDENIVKFILVHKHLNWKKNIVLVSI